MGFFKKILKQGEQKVREASNPEDAWDVAGQIIDPFSGTGDTIMEVGRFFEGAFKGNKEAKEKERQAERDLGYVEGTKAAEAYLTEFNKLIGGLGSGSSKDTLDIFSSLENMKSFQTDELAKTRNTMEIKAGSTDTAFKQEGFDQAISASALTDTMEAMFPKLQGRLQEIQGTQQAPGRRGAILTGRQNILG